VFLKEIVADESFTKGRAKLPIAVGKDIEGGPSVVDLARMPHLLVAGTTGSGKSVAINAFITSLLYHCSPEDVRMIMVDPKMLELSIYEGIPHLLLPVVTDPKKANLALRWAVEEMDRRYDLLAQMGVRDIGGYNDKVGKQLAKLEADKLRAAAEAASRAIEDDIGKAIAADSPAQADAREKIVTSPQHRLPYIVVVIDEFADLMMCAPKEVETSVARIAQKARASGIHLILATQRPSVDVITGLIKANFPSRIAFSVASKIDSRTILDQSGAEALLGAGDMLFSDRGAAPQRLHGCYVDEVEIQRVVDFLKTQGRPVYNLEILKPREEESEGGGEMSMPGGQGGRNDDDMYDKAVYIVTTTRNASISWVQRQLRIGYNRAARLVEEMEKQGVVSSPDHTNKREVLVAHA
jgi:S-DNA-T family DNA segregation ATPase FtsK/SpoIIIE